MKNKIHSVHGLSSHLLQPSTIDIAFSPVKLPKLFIKKNAEAPSPPSFPYYRYYNIRLIPFDFFILSHSLFLLIGCHLSCCCTSFVPKVGAWWHLTSELAYDWLLYKFVSKFPASSCWYFKHSYTCELLL